MNLNEFDVKLRSETWCRGYEISNYGSEIKISTLDLKKASSWCIENIPLGVKWELFLDERK